MSELYSCTHALIVEAFAEASLSTGAVSLVSNASADAAGIVGALIDHPHVKRERIIVIEGIADAFTAKFAAKAASMKAGDPSAGNTTLGAVVDRKSVDWVGASIDDAVAKGAKRLTGTTTPMGGGDGRDGDRSCDGRHENLWS